MTGYAPVVREYLAYCRKSAAELKTRGSSLDPKHHPTPDGAVKLIPHRGDPAEARQIRQAFRDLTEESAQ